VKKADSGKPLRKVLSVMGKIIVAAIILLAALILVVKLTLDSGKREMERACGLAPIGSGVSEVKAAISQNGFHMFENHMADSHGQYIQVITRKGMGRYGCKIYHDGDKVIGADITFTD